MGYKTSFCLDGHTVLEVCCVSSEYHILRQDREPFKNQTLQV